MLLWWRLATHAFVASQLKTLRTLARAGVQPCAPHRPAHTEIAAEHLGKWGSCSKRAFLHAKPIIKKGSPENRLEKSDSKQFGVALVTGQRVALSIQAFD